MNSGLSKYLGAVAHELRGLPEQKREAELREIQQHLESLIASRIESGAGKDEAARSAVAQFGSARKIGRKLRRAHQRREATWRTLAAPVCGMLGQLALIWVVLGGMFLVDKLLGFGSGQLFEGYQSHILLDIGFTILLHMAPVGGGILAGRIAPRSALWSAPLMSAAILTSSLLVFPFNASALSLLSAVIPVFIGAVIGSRWAHKLERA
jgi:hypothetical protein